MGIFDYYLVNKLKSIKESIKNVLIDKGVEVTDKDTFESCVEKINDVTTLKRLLDYTKSTNNIFSNSIIKELPSKLFNFSDTSNVTTMSSMFYSCTNLQTVPLFDTSNVTTMSDMFYSCTNLQTVPLFDTSNVTAMGDMFYSCKLLKTVKELNMKSALTVSRMFYNCTVLTNCNLKNIKSNLTIGSGKTYGHLLTIDSLVGIIKELVNVNSSRTLTIGSANLTKIANIYVKLIDVTDEMRAEDELIDSKLPCEVCESTDEGAMLLKSYAYEKKWTLK